MTSWYLYILKGGPDKKTTKPLGDAATITKHMSAAFPGISWASATEATCADKRFSLELCIEKGVVQRVILKVGKMKVEALAQTCKREGWRLEDPDVEVEEDVDLDDPEAWFVRMHG